MIKKVILLGIFLSSLFGIEYKNESEINKIDLNIFVGAEYGISYNNSDNDNFDDILNAFGLFVGIPIYNGIEFVIKYKLQNSNAYDKQQGTIALNFPLYGESSREVYLGIIAGKSIIDFTNEIQKSELILNNSYDGVLYGAHFGKKFRYTRDFGVRVELEYLHFADEIEASNKTYEITNGLEFIYAIEYRF